MTSDILYILRDAVIAQRDSSKLITIKQELIVESVHRLDILKTQFKVTGDEDIKEEHEALVSVLEEIQELRADIIWNAVRFCDESFACDAEVGNFTEREKEIFEPLCRLSMKLRGMYI